LRGTRGIRDDAESHDNPETPRGAKEQVEERMTERRSYSESVDQAALTAMFDMAVTYRACRSFRRMVKAFTEIIVALGVDLPNPWPPMGGFLKKRPAEMDP
jgi:hypothetical protein